MSSDHPKQWLGFSAHGSWGPDSRARVNAMLAELTASRSWSLGPPVAEWADNELRGGMAIHSAFPPWGEKLSYEVDAAEYEQTVALVETLAGASRELGVTITLELDGDDVGDIQGGVPDRGISEVLLAEWKNGLARPRAPVI